MHRFHKKLWSAGILVLGVGVAGIALGGDEEVDDGLDVWFRTSDLEALSSPEVSDYTAEDPGDSELLDRAWDGAPPQIPHNVDDMLPILGDENECVDCHHPENVLNKKDAPIPKSHFERTLMGAGGEGDAQVWKVVGHEATEELVGMRWNCVMCHTPQAANVATPASSFRGLQRAKASEPEPSPAPADSRKKGKKKKGKKKGKKK